MIIFCGLCDTEMVWYSFADSDGKRFLEASLGSNELCVIQCGDECNL